MSADTSNTRYSDCLTPSPYDQVQIQAHYPTRKMTALDRSESVNVSESSLGLAMRRLWVLAGMCLLLSACGGDFNPDQQGMATDDPVWVAISQTMEWGTTTGLLPVGRYGAGEWDLPWAKNFAYGNVAPIDSSGGLRSAHELLPPLDYSDPKRLHLDAPLQWHHYYFAEQEDSLNITDLALARARCQNQWVLYTDAGEIPVIEESRWYTGVAFNRPMKAVSADIEIPNLESIQDSLGLVSNGLDRYDRDYLHFLWLGFYRLEDGGVFGVVIDFERPSTRYKIVAFHGDQGHVVVDVISAEC